MQSEIVDCCLQPACLDIPYADSAPYDQVSEEPQ